MAFVFLGRSFEGRLASPLPNSSLQPVSTGFGFVWRASPDVPCRHSWRHSSGRLSAGSAPPPAPPPPKKAPHACKINPTPPSGNLSFISLSPFRSTPSPASPQEGAAPPGKMRIETARDTDHRTSPPNFPGQFGLLSASGPGQTLPCSGCDHPPRIAFPRGPFAGGRFSGFFWKRPVQVPSTGARGASFIKQSPKRKRGVKQPGNTEHEKAVRQQKMRNNRPAMHHAPALSASSQLGASQLPSAPSLSSSSKPSARQASSPARLSTKGSAPAKKHPQPPRNCTVSGTFQPENSRNEGNTYYKLNRQTTHSYTTYGNTRGAEEGKIAETR